MYCARREKENVREHVIAVSIIVLFCNPPRYNEAEQLVCTEGAYRIAVKQMTSLFGVNELGQSTGALSCGTSA